MGKEQMEVYETDDTSVLEMESIKSRFGNIIFDEIINSNCINCYRVEQKTKQVEKPEKGNKGKLFYFNFM